MKTLLRIITCAVMAALCAPMPASAYAISQPHTYVDGETLSQSILNPNFQTIYSWANGGIDNSNIGTAGIYLSQIKPTSTATATLYTAWGLTFGTSSGSQVALTVEAPASPTVDVLDVINSSAAKQVWIDSSFLLHTNAAVTIGTATQSGSSILTVNGTTTTNEVIAPSAQQLIVSGSSGATAVLVNYGTGATGGLSVWNGGTSAFGPLSAGAASFAGAIQANGGVTSAGQTTILGNPAVLVNYGGGGSSGLSIYNGSTSSYGPLTASTGAFSGSISAGAASFAGAIQANGGVTSVGQTLINAASGANAVLVNYGGGANAGLDVFDGTTSNDININVVSSSSYFTISGSGNFYFKNSGGSAYAPVYGGAYTNASDRRWKQHIRITRYGLAAVLALRPRDFEWRANRRRDTGFVAQEVAHVLPDLVRADNRGYLGVEYANLTAVLVRAIQEQQVEIDLLRHLIRTHTIRRTEHAVRVR